MRETKRTGARWCRGGAALFALALACSLAPRAAAQGSSSADQQALAQTLFDDARGLMQRGDYASACPKLEAASKLYAGSGVLLNLGDCYEHVGREASAFTAFGEAALAASRLGRGTDEAEARRRQTALEPKLSRLEIRVTKDVPGLVVKDGDKPVDRATWGIDMPVDPGTHALSAEAPGRKPWSKSVDITEPGKTVVVLPELPPNDAGAPAPAPTTSAPPHAPPEARSASPSYWTGRRIIGAGMVGVGVVAAAVAGGIALDAKSKYNVATGESGAARHDDSVRALGEANAATAVCSIGAALAIAGAVVWLSAPDAPVAVGFDGGALLVRGRF